MSDRFASLLVSDRSLRVAGWVTLALVVLMLILAGLTIPGIASNTEANVRTDDLASCRASYRAEIDDANFQVTIALGEAQSALSDGVIASIRQDPTTLALVAGALETAEAHKDAAYADLAEANERYDAAVALSRERPDDFLASCREDQ